MLLYRLLLIVLCLVGAVGCLADAERTNPLDPRSDLYQDAGSISGTVVNRRFQPVEGVEARLHPVDGDSGDAFVSHTGRDGGFRFDTIPSGTYVLRLGKEGFSQATDTAEVHVGRATHLPEVSLNALPAVADAFVTTAHISRWWPEDDLYVLDLSISVIDPDERPGIDSVYFVMPADGLRAALRPSQTPGIFVRVLPADSLPGRSVHELVGKKALAHIVDQEGNSVLRPIQGPVRVIDQTPAAIHPQGLETVEDPRPTLEWAPLQLPFAITYRLEVLRDEVNTDVLVQQYENIPADSTRFRLPTALAQGSYFWTVAVVDAFGNVSRSKEAGFRVN